MNYDEIWNKINPVRPAKFVAFYGQGGLFLVGDHKCVRGFRSTEFFVYRYDGTNLVCVRKSMMSRGEAKLIAEGLAAKKTEPVCEEQTNARATKEGS